MKQSYPLMSNAYTFEQSVAQSVNEGVGPAALLKMQLDATGEEISQCFVEFDKKYVSSDMIREMDQDDGFAAVENLYQGFKPFWIRDMITMLQLFMLNQNVTFSVVNEYGANDVTDDCRQAVNIATQEMVEKFANEVATRYAKQVASISMWMKTGYAFSEQSMAFCQIDPSPLLAVRLLDKILIDAGIIGETTLNQLLIENSTLDAFYEADDDDLQDSGPVLVGISDASIN